MPRARHQLVSVSDTPYYHVYSRCVRRAFLCGVDHYSGRSYEHRRQWIEDRIRVLSSLFSIDLCAYAVMSNHYHLVVKLSPAEAKHWSDDDVLERWTVLYKGPLLVQRYCASEKLDRAELDTLRSITAVYRQRLTSLSWFMKCLNEPVARQANAEDGCTGHFWEARFQSQPLRSEQALLSAMAYVDLNSVRSGMAKTPEGSDYTSVRARIRGKDTKQAVQTAVKRLRRREELHHGRLRAKRLLPFATRNKHKSASRCLPIHRADYLNLVDITGRQIVTGKRGRIDPAVAPILERLGLSLDDWNQASSAFRTHYRNGELTLSRPA